MAYGCMSTVALELSYFLGYSGKLYINEICKRDLKKERALRERNQFASPMLQLGSSHRHPSGQIFYFVYGSFQVSLQMYYIHPQGSGKILAVLKKWQRSINSVLSGSIAAAKSSMAY